MPIYDFATAAAVPGGPSRAVHAWWQTSCAQVPASFSWAGELGSISQASEILGRCTSVPEKGELSSTPVGCVASLFQNW
eukprot:1159163-Pelagomonas_calceolata.AAC.5